MNTEIVLALLALALIFALLVAKRVGEARDRREREITALRTLVGLPSLVTEGRVVCGPCADRGVPTYLRIDELSDGPVRCPRCGHDFGVSLDGYTREVLRQIKAKGGLT